MKIWPHTKNNVDVSVCFSVGHLEPVGVCYKLLWYHVSWCAGRPFLGPKRLFYPVEWSQDRVKTSPCSLTRACWSLRRQYCAKGGALRDAIPNRFLTDDFFIWEKSWRIECWALEYFSPRVSTFASASPGANRRNTASSGVIYSRYQS